MKKMLISFLPFVFACNMPTDSNQLAHKKASSDTTAALPAPMVVQADYQLQLPAVKWSGIKEMTDETFKRQVLSSSSVTLVDFNATWCGPCKMLKPALARLVKEYDGKINFASVDVDECPKTASLYQIQSIPTLAFYQNAKQGNTIIGLQPYEELKKMIDTRLSESRSQ